MATTKKTDDDEPKKGKSSISDDLKTEQDKGAPDPVGEPVEPGEKVETMQQQGIGARTPYPTKE